LSFHGHDQLAPLQGSVNLLLLIQNQRAVVSAVLICVLQCSASIKATSSNRLCGNLRRQGSY
jgi:hypothetical protein